MIEEQQEKEEVQINLGELFSYYLKKWLIIVIVFIVGCVGGFVVGCVLPDTYTETAGYVLAYSGEGNESLQDAYKDQTAVSAVLSACQKFTEYNKFRSAVLAAMPEKYQEGGSEELTEDDLADLMTFEVTTSSSSSTSSGNFIYVTVTSSSAQLSYDIMRVILDIYPDYIKTNYTLANDENLEFSLMSDIVSVADLDGEPVMGKIPCTLIGGLGCLVVVLIVLAIIYMTDYRVKSEDELTEKYGAAILAAIPDYYDKNLVGTNAGGVNTNGLKN